MLIKSIYVCYTPLHTSIAHSIIKLNKDQKPHIINLYKNSTKQASKSKALFLLFLWRLKYKRTKFLCGNPKKSFSRAAIKILNPESVMLFDDGIGSINGSGYFFEALEEPIARLITKIFRLSTYAETLSTAKHYYSIYPKSQNYCPNIPKTIISIEHGKNLDSEPSIPPGSIVFIGSCLAQDGLIEIEEEKKSIQDFLTRNTTEKNLFYIPHPRENPNSLPTKINSNRITIIRPILGETFLEKNKHNIKSIYSLYSTLALHLPETPTFIYRQSRLEKNLGYGIFTNSNAKVIDAE